MIRQTHTYVTLPVSPAAYDEIAEKLKAADYGHAFMDDGEIDMQGLALTREEIDTAAINRLRGTGRTRQMIESAPHAALIVGVSDNHALMLSRVAETMHRTDLKFVGLASFHRYMIGREWLSAVLLDHWAIETASAQAHQAG